LEKHYLHGLNPGFNKNDVLRDLMTTYGDDVWNFAFFLTHRSDAADDIAQEVFLAAFNQLYSFRGDCSVKSWLLTIARNKSLNHMKSSFLRKVLLIDKIHIQDKVAPSAESVVFDRIESIELWSTVMKLPRKFKEVILLDYHYDLTLKEMGELLRISEGTVKSRLNRAKKKMSILLEREK
jgi:RNA polymerase sigma-70 factor (ECF subfamily)